MGEEEGDVLAAEVRKDGWCYAFVFSFKGSGLYKGVGRDTCTKRLLFCPHQEEEEEEGNEEEVGEGGEEEVADMEEENEQDDVSQQPLWSASG